MTASSKILAEKKQEMTPANNTHLDIINPQVSTILSMSDAKAIGNMLQTCKFFRNYGGSNRCWGDIVTGQYGRSFDSEDNKLQFRAHTSLKDIQNTPWNAGGNKRLTAQIKLKEFLHPHSAKKWTSYFFASIPLTLCDTGRFGLDALFKGDFRAEKLLYEFFLKTERCYFNVYQIDQFIEFLDADKSTLKSGPVKATMMCVKATHPEYERQYHNEAAIMKNSALKAFFKCIKEVTDPVIFTEYLKNIFWALYYYPITRDQLMLYPATPMFNKIESEIQSIKPFNIKTALTLEPILYFFQKDPVCLATLEEFLSELEQSQRTTPTMAAGI